MSKILGGRMSKILGGRTSEILGGRLSKILGSRMSNFSDGRTSDISGGRILKILGDGPSKASWAVKHRTLWEFERQKSESVERGSSLSVTCWSERSWQAGLLADLAF